MKKFVLLWICALGVCLVGCSDDDTPEQLPDPELTLAPDAPIAFPAKGGNVEIAVTTNMETWSAVSDQEWCKVAASAGKFTVSAVENETLAPMPAATVTVTASTGERSVSRKLQVSQEAGKEKIVDLSEAGTSNCYLVTAAGNYSFDATVRGNGATTEGLDAPTAIAGTSAAVVWQSAPGLISGVTLADGRISFKIAGPGNAVIAVKDGAILWSWHIWYPEAEVAGLNSKTGYEVMNMNLGAMHNTPGDVGSYGLLYQWGRKDPFPAAPTLTGTTATVGAPIYDGDNNEIKITNSSQSSTADNNLAFAIANPTVCLSNYAQFSTSRDWLQADASNDALWGNPKGAERNETNDFLNKGAKSFYDPCPVGWRVPPADVFRNFTASGGYAWVIDDFDIADISGDGAKSLADYDYGWTFNLSDSASSYFPAAARFDGSYAMLMGSMSGLWGSYWGNAPYPGDRFQGGAYSVLSFQIKDTAGNEMITTSPAGGGARADAYSVRCIREYTVRMHLQRNREPNVGSRFRLRGELPVGNEQTRGLRAVEVFALEDMDEEDEHRQQQRAEDNAHEPEKRQADEHAENRHERMRVGHSLL